MGKVGVDFWVVGQFDFIRRDRRDRPPAASRFSISRIVLILDSIQSVVDLPSCYGTCNT